jgi:hypothetical protein
VKRADAGAVLMGATLLVALLGMFAAGRASAHQTVPPHSVVGICTADLAP